MSAHRKRRDTTARLGRALAVCACVAAGCRQASPSDPQPITGGQVYVMSYDEFAANVEPVLSGLGCDNMNCHGGANRGAFALSPHGDKDPAFDFAQSCLQVYGTDPSASPLILKPLAAECGGTTHAGGEFFFALDDPGYVAILTWIENGEYR